MAVKWYFDFHGSLLFVEDKKTCLMLRLSIEEVTGIKVQIGGLCCLFYLVSIIYHPGLSLFPCTMDVSE